MEFPDPKINAYAEAHTSPEGELLAELNRDTNAHVMFPRMLSGHLQGRLLSMLSKMIQPKKILEIGTYTGYSALCLGEGLQDGGMLHTIELNPEHEEMIRKYFRNAGAEKKITLHIGNAKKIIPTLNEIFDLIFIDADKENYSAYFELVFPMLRTGGYIFADNTFWSGKVIEPIDPNDKETRGIVEFNNKVQADNRVENVLLPVRDGVMILRKK
jgi:predicted O-methyltransferase YrrM